jgi:hypothetical protein
MLTLGMTRVTWGVFAVWLASCSGTQRSYIPLLPDESARYDSEGGTGAGGDGPQSAPYVRLDRIASPQLGGSNLPVSFTARDEDGLVTIDWSLFFDESEVLAPTLIGASDTGFVVPLPVGYETTFARVRLRVTDSRNNATFVDSNDFAIDATPPPVPVVTWLSASPTAEPEARFSVSNCEPGTSVAWTIDGSEPSVWQACTELGIIPLSADGDYALRVYAKDAPGNVSYASDVFVVTLDRTAPVVTLTAPAMNAALQTASTNPVSYSVSELHLGPMAMRFEVSLDGGATYSRVADDDYTGSYTWTTPSTATATARLRVVATDTVGNSAFAEVPVLLDGTPPVFTLLQAEGAVSYEPPPELGDPLTSLDITGEDDISGLTHFCLKQTQGPTLPAPPTAADPCWVSVNDGSVSATVGGSPPGFAISNFAYRYGVFREIPYRVLVWGKDRSGRISSNAGVLGGDRINLIYDPGSPPAVTNVFVMTSDTPAWPLSPAVTTAGASTPVYIKWNVSYPNNTPPSAGLIDIRLGDGTIIAQDLDNAAGAGCSIDQAPPAPTFTGCYLWNAGGKPAGNYDIRVVARDRKNIATARTAVPPLNATDGTSGIEFYAGNTDPGIGGNALSTYFNTETQYNCMRGSLAVSSRGVVYFLDRDNGLFWVDPITGNSELLLRLDRVLGSTGDGGPVRQATTGTPQRIDMDLQDRLYVNEKSRLRRIDVDAEGKPTTITTVIGGGAVGVVTGPGIDPLSIAWECAGCSVISLPNGDFYTFQNVQQTGTTFRILHYSGGLVNAIPVTGSGWLADGVDASTTPIEDCHMYPYGGEVDIATSTLKSIVLNVGGYGEVGSTCTIDHGYGWALVGADGHTLPLINPATTYFNATTTCQMFNGLDGHLYWLNSNTAGDPGNNKLYRRESNGAWTPILGSGVFDSTNCADGVAGNACQLNVPTYFVTGPKSSGAVGDLFWSADGLMRTLDRNGNVLSLMGQPSYFGDSPFGGPSTPSLSARIGVTTHLDWWIDGSNVLRMVMLDVGNGRIREAEQGGVIRTLAGNGVVDWTGYATTSPAYDQPVLLQATTTLAVDSRPGHGEIYLDWDGEKGGMLQLDRPANQSLGQWRRVVGCTAPTGCTRYDAADGLPGSQIGYSQYVSLDEYDSIYWAPLVGFHNGKLLQSLARYYMFRPTSTEPYTGEWRDALFEDYDIDSGFVQTRFAGVIGPAPTGYTGPTGVTVPQGVTGPTYYTEDPIVFPNYSRRAQSPTGMYAGAWNYGHPDSVFDAGGARWLHTRGSTVYNTSIAALPLADGFVSTWALTNRSYSAFAIRRSGPNEYIYYCQSNYYAATNPHPNDNRIIAARIGGGAEVAIPWPIPGVHCTGTKMFWDERDPLNPRLVFLYERQGLYGVAAYRNPPLPP